MTMKNRLNGFLKKSFFLALLSGAFLSVQTPQSFAQNAPDPCPVPRALAQESPPDMASVQADIDILSLCVERAKLLEQLNQLVREMDTSSAQIPTTLGGFPPVKGNDELFALPKTNQPANTAPSQQEPPAEEIIIQETEVVEPGPDWVIRKIGGNQTDGIQAELKNADGTIVRAKKGDTLFDGAFVKDVSIMGVVVQKGGQDTMLGWE